MEINFSSNNIPYKILKPSLDGKNHLSELQKIVIVKFWSFILLLNENCGS